ncbi:hypothetical protein [Nonomuraea turcica]|uniref:hypothetical protein n=1 Tax=Nonomuraea sp. G32 TaxID=3067274 RepID=UPI00273C0E59|nr:hypothetical protein [Nonomuraea sp. G32]MDP4504428.1 hypothetical protein [Nonomuraea sp. G32]
MVLTGSPYAGNGTPGGPERMAPVTKIVIGCVFAFGALRFNGFDLLLDPVGWALCVSGLSQLQRSADDSFARARSAAIVMVVASLVAMVPSGAHPSDAPMDFSVKHTIGTFGTAGALITIWLVADAVIRRIRPHGETSRAALLDVLRWAVVALGALGLLTAYGYADLGFVTPIAWFTALVALIVVLYRSARLPCLSPA